MENEAEEIEELEDIDELDEVDSSGENDLAQSANKNILIVADESAEQFDYSKFLQDNGCNVVETSKIAYVPQLLKERDFCAVFLIGDDESFFPESFVKSVSGIVGANLVRIVHSENAPEVQKEIPYFIMQNFQSDAKNLLFAIRQMAQTKSHQAKIANIRATINGFLVNSKTLFSFMMPEQLISTVLRCFTKIANQDNGFIQVSMREADSDEQKTLFAGLGKYDVPIQNFYENISVEIKKQMAIAKTKKTIEISPSGVVFPLRGFNDSIFGVIFLEMSEFDNDIFNLLTVFVRQAAVLINNSMMHKMLDQQSEQLMRSNMQLNKSYLEVVQALREAVDAKDRYTHGHSERVAMYAVEIGKRMGLSGKSIEDLRVGGIFHDIGKIAVKDEILLKKSRLTDEEYEQIKIHPIKGGDILSGITMFKDVVPIVEGHHEHYDGTGYPRKLKGDEISFEARIMCVADAFDAMTSNREYHKKITFEEALDRIMQVRGKQFDPQICDAFADLIYNDKTKMQEISEFFGNAN